MTSERSRFTADASRRGNARLEKNARELYCSFRRFLDAYKSSATSVSRFSERLPMDDACGLRRIRLSLLLYSYRESTAIRICV